MLVGSSVVVFVLGMATMFILLYFSIAYSGETTIPAAQITQEEALRIVENDLKQRLSDYKGIVGILDSTWSEYVPISEDKLELPLVYVHSNGSLVLMKDSGYEYGGTCDTGLAAFCGWYDKYNFDYGSRLVYGVELQIDSKEEVLVMYMVDATNGRIVDSTFLRSDWIRAHSDEES